MTITVWNRSKRIFKKLVNAEGKKQDLDLQGSIEMDEVAGLRLINDYPKDLTSTKTAAPSSADLKRREQSLRDRAKRLDERAAALDAREAALKTSEASDKASAAEPPHRGPGRPPKAPEAGGA